MLELLGVIAGVGLLAALGLLLPQVAPGSVLGAGIASALVGLALGVPTGLVYHLRLRAALGARAALPPRWWIHPTALHGDLRPGERRRVLPWFAAGGAGFAATVLGCALVVLGVALQALEAQHALAR